MATVPLPTDSIQEAENNNPSPSSSNPAGLIFSSASFSLPIRSSQESSAKEDPSIVAEPSTGSQIKYSALPYRTPLAPKVQSRKAQSSKMVDSNKPRWPVSNQTSNANLQSSPLHRSSPKNRHHDLRDTIEYKSRMTAEYRLPIKSTPRSINHFAASKINDSVKPSAAEKERAKARRIQEECIALAALLAEDAPLGQIMEASFMKCDLRLKRIASFASNVLAAGVSCERGFNPDDRNEEDDRGPAQKRRLGVEVEKDVRVHNVCAERIQCAIAKEMRFRQGRNVIRGPVGGNRCDIGKIAVWKD